MFKQICTLNTTQILTTAPSLDVQANLYPKLGTKPVSEKPVHQQFADPSPWKSLHFSYSNLRRDSPYCPAMAGEEPPPIGRPW
jgi:hypothetical protein